MRAVSVVAEGAVPAPAASSRGLKVSTVLCGAVLLLVVGNVGRIPVLDLGDRAAPLLINDLALAVVLAAGALALQQTRSLHLDDTAIAAFIFATVGALSAVAAVPRFGLTPLELIASLAYLARWCFYFALYLVIINYVRARDAQMVWLALEWALLAIAAFGIVQAIFLPDFAFILYPDAAVPNWDSQKHRLVSTILDPNAAAAMIAIVLLVQLARMACGDRIPLWKPTLLVIAIAVTLSRSGVLAVLAGGSLILATRRLNRRMVRFAGVLFVLFLASLPKLVVFAAGYQKLGFDDDSALARLVSWQRALATFIDHPWFGVGFNTYGFVQDHLGFERRSVSTYSSEGGLLFVAVMTGIVGLLIYVAMLAFVVRRCRRGWRDPRALPNEQGLLIGTAAATLAILVHSVFVNTLLMAFVMEMLWVLWGLSFITTADISRRATIPVE